jgi:hypothetical protein
MKLPVYKLDINEWDEETGIEFVSLVESPAIQKDFLAFNQEFVEPNPNESEDEFISRCVPILINEGKDNEQAVAICYSYWEGERIQKVENQKFAIQDEEKRIVTGAAMIADLPIYRRDDIRGEYYVVFDKESIFKIAKKWARGNKYDAVNAHHRTPIMDGVSLFESYIIDRERGVMPPKGFEEVADGSWFVSYLVDNDDVWARVKEGEFKGFSVEGVFDFPEDKDEQILEALKEVLSKWNGK